MTNQFENIYPLNFKFEDNPGYIRKQKHIEDEQIRIQSSLPRRPSNIAFFENIMYDHDFPPEKSTPRVGYFCNMIPVEIIMALGIQPVRIDCGNNASALVGEEVLSGDICPLAKASFGTFMYKTSITHTYDALIIPTSCDAKRKMGEILNNIKPTFMLNLPPEQNHSLFSKTSYKEVLRLVGFLQEQFDRKLDKRQLHESIKQLQQRTLHIRRLQRIRTLNASAISIMDFFLIIQSSFLRPNDISEWLKQTEIVCKELDTYEEERKSLRPRLILTGAPMVWPNFKVLNVLEESGADIVADTLCTGAQSCFDPIVINEYGKRPLLRALNNRYIYASICPCFISQTTRINRILDLVDECQADGVVNYSLRLCQLFDVENYLIERALKERKIPFINIHTDYSLEDTEQLRVRIEAFLETL